MSSSITTNWLKLNSRVNVRLCLKSFLKIDVIKFIVAADDSPSQTVLFVVVQEIGGLKIPLLIVLVKPIKDAVLLVFVNIIVAMAFVKHLRKVFVKKIANGVVMVNVVIMKIVEIVNMIVVLVRMKI